MTTQACVAAIQFAIEYQYDGGMQFLENWNEGNFDACREEWPEAPEDCYWGADAALEPIRLDREDAEAEIAAREVAGHDDGEVFHQEDVINAFLKGVQFQRERS